MMLHKQGSFECTCSNGYSLSKTSQQAFQVANLRTSRWRRSRSFQQQEDYHGGSFHDDILSMLPGMFFSYDYSRSLAATCKHLFMAVRSVTYWRNKTISMNVPEFDDPAKLRAMRRAYTAAGMVTFNLRQLAMLHDFPERFLLEWNYENVPQFQANSNFFSFQSDGPLMGCASFEITLPANIKGLYIGVRQWRVIRPAAFFRIDNVFQDNCTVSASMNSQPPVPHAGRRAEIQPNRPHKFSVIWHQRMLELSIDNVGVSRARLLDGHEDSVSPLAQLFVWISASSPTTHAAATFKPLPSMVQLHAQIQCAMCRREYNLNRPRWAVCPLCMTWICQGHVQHSPARRCPNCPSQLMDFVGGSSQNLPYVNAAAYYKTNAWTEWSDLKHVGVVAKIFRQNTALFDRMPSAVDLLPDPQERLRVGKRQWEQVMYRARNIIAFLAQDKNTILFHFLHELCKLDSCRLRVLEGLPHPAEFGNSLEWQSIALSFALRLHLFLAIEQERRSKQYGNDHVDASS